LKNEPLAFKLKPQASNSNANLDGPGMLPAKSFGMLVEGQGEGYQIIRWVFWLLNLRQTGLICGKSTPIWDDLG
jgi:hypothetical protein